MDEQNAHTEKQLNKSLTEYTKELDESREEEKEDNTKESEFNQSKEPETNDIYILNKNWSCFCITIPIKVCV